MVVIEKNVKYCYLLWKIGYNYYFVKKVVKREIFYSRSVIQIYNQRLYY